MQRIGLFVEGKVTQNKLYLTLQKQGYKVHHFSVTKNDDWQAEIWTMDAIVHELDPENLSAARVLSKSCKAYATPFIIISEVYNLEICNLIYQENPALFLVRPFNAINLTLPLKLISRNTFNKLEVEGNYGVKEINSAKIKLIRTNRNYLEVNTTGGLYKVRSTMKGIVNKLPENFVRINRFCIVNLEYIEEKCKSQILIDDRIIPVSRKYQKLLKFG